MVVNVPPAQLSVMTGGLQVATAWQDAFALRLMFDGQFVITGAMLSATVTLNVHVAVFPAASVAV